MSGYRAPGTADQRWEQLDVETEHKSQPRCLLCFSTRVRCLLCCVLPIILVALGTFFLWPRCITTLVDGMTVKSFHFTILPPKVTFKFGLSMSLHSDNYWGASVDSLQMVASYHGVPLAAGTVEGDRREKCQECPSDLRDTLTVLLSLRAQTLSLQCCWDLAHWRLLPLLPWRSRFKSSLTSQQIALWERRGSTSR